MPRLTRLRIAGFKSFADPVSLDILPGLTGIVGPNGCGKSNVVEALRWAMGETSARSLRGGEMDDVIFAGTAARASRNLAEVVVTLEAGAPEAGGAPLPAPFEAEAELQVIRRIERGAGSTFRANGQELRVRDVQTLYADLASGARSSSMVSQGRVADLVRARPEERRQVLEEAAGITGLHARRHEAELKLRAAEQNLARAADATARLDGARESLRRQASQAARYRAVSGLIRAAEADHLAVLHGRAAAALDQACAEYQQAEAKLATALDQQAMASAALADAERALPGLRGIASDARSALERCRFDAERLGERRRREAREAEAAQARAAELAADLCEAARAEQDAHRSLERLAAAIGTQTARLVAIPELIAHAQGQRHQAREALQAAEALAQETADRAREAAASANQAEAASRAAHDRLAVLQARLDTLLAELAANERLRIGPEQMAYAAAATVEAEAALYASRAALDRAETARAAAAEAVMPLWEASERALGRRQAAEEEARGAAGALHRARQALHAAEDAVVRHRSACIDPSVGLAAAKAAERAAAELAEAEVALETAEHQATVSATQAASARRTAEDARAAQERAQDALSAARSRAARIAADLDTAERALATADDGADEPARESAAAACRAAVEALTHHHDTWMLAKEFLRAATEAAGRARAALLRAEADATRLAAEIAGLEAASGLDDGQADVLSTLAVPDGLELAFGAAFGDAVHATLDQPDARAERRLAWRVLPPMAPPPLPVGCMSLASLATAPPSLARMLSYAALLADDVDGSVVQPMLPPGVIAVDRAGACWRWDGLMSPAGTQNRAAARLVLRRRLSETREGLHAALAHAVSAGNAVVVADDTARALAAQADLAANARDAAETAWQEAERIVERQINDAAHAAARRSALEPSVSLLRSQCTAANRAVLDAEDAAAALPDAETLEDAAASAEQGSAYAGRALEAARAMRGMARLHAATTVLTAQDLTSQASRAEALFEAAAAVRDRTAAEMQRAASLVSAAGAALAALPDPSIAAGSLTEAETEAADCRVREAEERELRCRAEAEMDSRRQAEMLLRLAHAEAEAKQAGLWDRVGRSRADLHEAERDAGHAEVALRSLPERGSLHAAADTARLGLEAARAAARDAEAAMFAIEAEQIQMHRLQEDAHAELAAWTCRLEEARSRHAALAARHRSADAACRAANTRPGEAAAETERAALAQDAADLAYQAAETALTVAEVAFRAGSATARDMSAQVIALRDSKARLHAAQEAGKTACAAVLARAAERLEPGMALPQTPDIAAPAEERSRRKHDRLSRERDEMGPVNLRAELELDEIEQNMAALAREREELSTAVTKLRGAIGHLNRVGRERLLAVFTEVDRHFRTLFTRMMGGGRAHLAMIGADDPLAAGLEIFAEPPGKKLSALSLLSGGEQALTALSLIFAVFRCTPAPLCVLDEVDAPLDDANVERFCTLLDDVVRDTGTSFLVVTHHQVTMSRMDRLFGVTMQERGVSRLLSVDLRRAVGLTAAGAAEALLQAAE